MLFTDEKLIVVTSKPPRRQIADPATTPIERPEVLQAYLVPGVNASSKLATIVPGFHCSD